MCIVPLLWLCSGIVYCIRVSDNRVIVGWKVEASYNVHACTCNNLMSVSVVVLLPKLSHQ